jgi:hypothetical protein
MRLRRTLTRALTAWLALLVLFTADRAAAQSKAFFYERIDVTVDVLSDGTLAVAETMTLNYQGGPFTSANRAIALQRLDDIRDIGLREGGQEYTQAADGKQPGTFVVERSGDSAKVSWYYPPTSDTTRSFTLRYRVEGAVRVGADENEVWWVAIFPDRTVPVQRGRVTLNLPSGGRPRPEDVTLPAADGSVSVESNSVVVSRDTPLAAGESLDLRVRFPSSLVAARKPAWQDAASGDTARSGSTLGALASAFLWPAIIVVALAGLAWQTILRKRWRRSSRAVSAAAVSQSKISGFGSRNLSTRPSKRKSYKRKNRGKTRPAYASSYSSDNSWSSASSASSSSSDSGSSWSSDSGSSWSSSSDSGSSSSDSGSGGGSGGAE